MTAAKKLVVLRLVTLGTIGRRQMGRNYEAAMIDLLLIAGRRMAIETRHTFAWALISNS